MNRRLFIFSVAACSLPAYAEPVDAGLQDGINYVTLPTASSASSKTYNEVIEAFSYTCIHCYRFEPVVQAWLKTQPPSLRFKRLPSQWDDIHRAHARLYRTLQILQRNDLDNAAFEAIHIQKQRLFSPDPAETLAAQTSFVVNHGVDATSFKAAYESDAVASALKMDAEALIRFEITETPAMVIDAKYVTDASHVRRATDVSEVSTFNRIIEVTNYLAIRRSTQSSRSS